MDRKKSSAPNDSTTGRFEALDGWRGICACFVVLYHVHAYSPIHGWSLVRNAYLFVDFFFVLSGFVISWNYGSRLGSWPAVQRFLVLRLGRVYPLHLFMLLCFVAWETARLLLGNQGETPPFTGGARPIAVLSNLFLVQSLNIHDGLTWNGPSWSISTEFWAYVIFAAVSLWFGMRNWILLLAAVALPLLLYRLSDTGMDTTYEWGLLRCVLGFALGVACQRIHNLRPPSTAGAHSGAMTVLELLAVGGVVAFVARADTSDWSFLAPFVFALAVLVFAAEGGAASRVLRLPLMKWLGKLSYSIYLTHFFFVMALPIVFKKLTHLDLWRPMALPNGQQIQAFGHTELQGALFYVAVLACTLAFSAFTYRWIETPGREWTRRWVGRPRSVARTAPCQGSVNRP
jgi:peptidoglycan/LPS O-acetylase OafA/YrhL